MLLILVIFIFKCVPDMPHILAVGWWIMMVCYFFLSLLRGLNIFDSWFGRHSEHFQGVFNLFDYIDSFKVLLFLCEITLHCFNRSILICKNTQGNKAAVGTKKDLSWNWDCLASLHQAFIAWHHEIAMFLEQECCCDGPYVSETNGSSTEDPYETEEAIYFHELNQPIGWEGGTKKRNEIKF